jgi:hypothetical protein
LVNGTEASDTLPSVKAIAPVGAAVPVADVTLAVRRVVAVGAIEVGLAVSAVVVTTGGITLTVTEPVELEKFPVAL